MTSASNTIAIAGAGIGGLTAALALARCGQPPTVFERRTDVSEAGAGIQLGPNATRVLAHLGILDSVRAFASEPDALSIHDALSGRVLARLPLGAWMHDRYGAPYLTLHRQDLHRVLATAVASEPLISVHTGRDVAGFINKRDGVEVIFRDGARDTAAALIAADGLWSTLRAEVTACAAPEPAGKCAYRAIVPRSDVPDTLAANDVHIWLAPGAHVVHYPVRAGAETAIVVVIDGAASQDGWDRAATRDTLLVSPVAEFAKPARDLIIAAQNWRMWPLQKLAPLPTWTKGAVALLGDAAHPLLPFFAQGGGLAIEDAAVLARCLTQSGAMPEKLVAYEAARRARAERVVAASILNGQIYHMRGAARAARNAVLSTMPAALLMRRYDWLYAWKP